MMITLEYFVCVGGYGVKKISLCIPSCPRTCYIDQMSLKLETIYLPLTHEYGTHRCPTVPSSITFFIMNSNSIMGTLPKMTHIDTGKKILGPIIQTHWVKVSFAAKFMLTSCLLPRPK